MTIYRVIALVLVLVVGTMIVLPSASAQGLIEQALKIFGIGYVISQFGGQINNFINNLAGQKGVKYEQATKVVPILSVGGGTFVGAVQVQGPPDRVDQVKAVGQVEARLGGARGTLLVPISTRTASGSSGLNRVPGVGVSALVDFKI